VTVYDFMKLPRVLRFSPAPVDWCVEVRCVTHLQRTLPGVSVLMKSQAGVMQSHTSRDVFKCEIVRSKYYTLQFNYIIPAELTHLGDHFLCPMGLTVSTDTHAQWAILEHFGDGQRDI